MANRSKYIPKTVHKFLKALATNAVVGYACDAANVCRRTAYQWRQDHPEFATAWEQAVETAIDRLEQEAWRRACEGVEKPVYQGGELVGHMQEYSNTLTIFLLKANRPEKYRERYEIQHGGDVNINVEVREMVVRTRPEAQAAAGLIESERVSDNGKA